MKTFLQEIFLMTILKTYSSLRCEDGYIRNNFCVIDGGWTSWNSWGPCVGECGSVGKRIRSRTCSNPSPSLHGSACIGSDIQIDTCQITGCTIEEYEQAAHNDPVLNEEMKMVRAVHERVPVLIELCFSANCGFPIVEKILGSDAMVYWNAMNCIKYGIGCPILGGWSNWSAWSSCSASCGKGQKYRERICNNPIPSDPELSCDKLPFEVNTCVGMNCRKHLDGIWSAWGEWSPCNVVCGIGIRTRKRSCTEIQEKPVQLLNDGKTSCEGLLKEIEACEVKDCSIDGFWSQWTAWSVCSSGCGIGVQSRNRMCSNPSPTGNGAICPGSATEVRQCFTKPCSVRKHKVAYFSGHSSLIFPPVEKDFRLLHIYTRFLPLNPHGTLVHRYKDEDFVKIFLKNGKVAVAAQISQCNMLMSHEKKLEIGEWHEILLMIYGTHALLRIDNGANKINFLSCMPFFPNLNHKMIIGTEYHGQLEKIAVNFMPIDFYPIDNHAFVDTYVDYFFPEDEEGFVRIEMTESLVAPCPIKADFWQISITLKPEDTNGIIAGMLGKNMNYYILLLLENGHVKLKFQQGNTCATVATVEHVVIREWIEIVMVQDKRDKYIQINGGEKYHIPIISVEIGVISIESIFIGAASHEAKDICPACVDMPRLVFTIGLLYIDENQIDLLSLPMQEISSKRFSSRTISLSDCYQEIHLLLGQELKLACFYDRNVYEEKISPPASIKGNPIWILMEQEVNNQILKRNTFVLNDNGRISTISAASYPMREAIEGFYACRIRYFRNGTGQSIKPFTITYGVAVVDESAESAGEPIWKSWACISCLLILLFCFTIVWLICEGIWDFRDGHGFFRYSHKTDKAELSSVLNFLSSTDALVLLGSIEAVEESKRKLKDRLQLSSTRDKDDLLIEET